MHTLCMWILPHVVPNVFFPLQCVLLRHDLADHCYAGLLVLILEVRGRIVEVLEINLRDDIGLQLFYHWDLLPELP